MPFIASFFVSTLVGGFAASIVQGLIKTAISIGVGFIVYQGLEVLFNQVMSQITFNFGNAQISGMLQMLKVDKALNVLASAVAVKYSLKATVNGLKKIALK